MTLEKHSLVKEFPDHQHTIRHLKMNDNHFAKLFDQYHQLDSEVHAIEQDNANKADEYLETLKKRRLSLKDQLYTLIKSTESSL